MIIARRILTRSGAYLVRRAVALAESLFRLSSKNARKHEVIDGYLLVGSRSGTRGSASVLDFPVYLLTPSFPFSLEAGTTYPHRDNATPLAPAIAGYSDYRLWTGAVQILPGRDALLEPGLVPDPPRGYADAQPGFQELVEVDGGTAGEDLISAIADTSAWPLGDGSMLVCSTGAILQDSSVIGLQNLVFTAWSTEIRYQDEPFNPPVEVAHRFYLTRVPPALDTYPSGNRIRGLLLKESDFDGIGVTLATRMKNYPGTPDYRLPTVFYPFEAQPLPWCVSCPLGPRDGNTVKFVFVAHCVLEQEPSMNDGYGKRGLVVGRAIGQYNEETGSTPYTVSMDTVVPAGTGEQAPQLNDQVAAGPANYFWMNNGYQPSVLAPFGSGRVLAIHRHYVGRIDITGPTSLGTPGAADVPGYDQLSARQNVHVFAQLIDETGVLSQIDVVSAGHRYTPSSDGPETVFYDGIMGAASNGEGQAVSFALGFSPGWQATPMHHAEAELLTPEEDQWEEYEVKFLGVNSEYNIFYDVSNRYLHERSSADPRYLGIAVFSENEGALSVQTQRLPFSLYPLAEYTIMAYPSGVNAWFATLQPNGVHQAHLSAKRDSIPSTTQGVAYIGNGKYLFLAATDVNGMVRVAVTYDVAEDQLEQRGLVFDASQHPVRTAASTIQCIQPEEAVDGVVTQEAIIVSTHADSGVGVWPLFGGSWKDSINNQVGHRGAGEYGVTMISYDSGYTWEKLADAGGFPGVAFKVGLL